MWKFGMLISFTYKCWNSSLSSLQFRDNKGKIDLWFLRPEDKIKKLERRITELIDESCLAASKQQLRQALDKAKEASTKERNLIRLQEQAGLSDTHNLDLTFSVGMHYRQIE